MGSPISNQPFQPLDVPSLGLDHVPPPPNNTGPSSPSTVNPPPLQDTTSSASPDETKAKTDAAKAQASNPQITTPSASASTALASTNSVSTSATNAASDASSNTSVGETPPAGGNPWFGDNPMVGLLQAMSTMVKALAELSYIQSMQLGTTIKSIQANAESTAALVIKSAEAEVDKLEAEKVQAICDIVQNAVSICITVGVSMNQLKKSTQAARLEGTEPPLNEPGTAATATAQSGKVSVAKGKAKTTEQASIQKSDSIAEAKGVANNKERADIIEQNRKNNVGIDNFNKDVRAHNQKSPNNQKAEMPRIPGENASTGEWTAYKAKSANFQTRITTETQLMQTCLTNINNMISPIGKLVSLDKQIAAVIKKGNIDAQLELLRAQGMIIGKMADSYISTKQSLDQMISEFLNTLTSIEKGYYESQKAMFQMR